MEDIGMSPDYRSGVQEYDVCHICEQKFLTLLGNCVQCGKATCLNCVSGELKGYCLKCAKEHCPFCGGDKVYRKHGQELPLVKTCHDCDFVWDTGWSKERLAQEMDAFDNDLAWKDHTEDTERQRAAERGVL